MNTSINSVSFVITAIYTITFGNSVIQILEFNDVERIIALRQGTSLPIVLCSLICMTMTLRFFFGNNNYVDKIFSTPTPSIHRLYHFAIIAIQSLILLGSSYVIRNPVNFVIWICVLFVVELIWYLGCYLFIRGAISETDGKLNRLLALNEIANLGMVLGVVIPLFIFGLTNNYLIYLVTLIFIINSSIDIKVNLDNYMGD